MIIKPLLMSAFETALNHYLALDNGFEPKLKPLSGKVIAVNIQPFNEIIYLCPGEHTIQFLDNVVEPPLTTITGSLAALGLMGLSATPMRAIFSGDVVIEGDIHTGQKLQQLFADLNIDLESHLAKYTGEKFSGQISNFFSSLHQWGTDAIDSIKLNTSEYLQEERQDLPAPLEVDDFYTQIDLLRNDFDRLQARVQRLQEADPHKDSAIK